MTFRDGSRIPRRKGCQPTILPTISKKLHEIAKNFGPWGGRPLLDPPLTFMWMSLRNVPV